MQIKCADRGTPWDFPLITPKANTFTFSVELCNNLLDIRGGGGQSTNRISIGRHQDCRTGTVASTIVGLFLLLTALLKLSAHDAVDNGVSSTTLVMSVSETLIGLFLIGSRRILFRVLAICFLFASIVVRVVEVSQNVTGCNCFGDVHLPNSVAIGVCVCGVILLLIDIFCARNSQILGIAEKDGKYSAFTLLAFGLFFMLAAVSSIAANSSVGSFFSRPSLKASILGPRAFDVSYFDGIDFDFLVEMQNESRVRPIQVIGQRQGGSGAGCIIEDIPFTIAPNESKRIVVHVTQRILCTPQEFVQICTAGKTGRRVCFDPLREQSINLYFITTANPYDPVSVSISLRPSNAFLERWKELASM